MAVMIDLKSIINLDEIDELTAGLENINDIIRLAQIITILKKLKKFCHLKQKGFIVHKFDEV